MHGDDGDECERPCEGARRGDDEADHERRHDAGEIRAQIEHAAREPDEALWAPHP